MNETSNENENANDYDFYGDENSVRSKRQAEFNDMADMSSSDPAGGDFQDTFKTMVNTVVDGAKLIAQTFSEAFESNSEDDNN